MARLIPSCTKEYGLATVQKGMECIRANAKRVIRNPLRKIYNDCSGLPVEAINYLGMCLKININPKKGSAAFKFTGTTNGLLGNPDASRGIMLSAILYVLRSLVNEDIPLNQGCCISPSFVALC